MHIKLLLIILLLGALAGWNCTGRGSIEQNCDERLLTSFIASKKDSMLNHPGKLIQTYQKLRENTTDSLTSYALLHAISQCYWWGGHRDSATATTLRVINCCEQATSTPCLQRLLANVYYTHANRFANIAEYDTAMIYYEKALDAASKSGVVDSQPRIYFSIAANFERKSDYTNATYYYRKALFVADSVQVEAPYFVINLSLAKLYGEIDNREMAEFYFRQLEKDLYSKVINLQKCD